MLGVWLNLSYNEIWRTLLGLFILDIVTHGNLYRQTSYVVKK